MQITFPNLNGSLEIYLDCLNAIIGDDRESMIDLGCCFAPNTPLLGFKKRKYVDIIYRKLDHKKEQKYFVQGDILYTPLEVRYSVSIAADCCEHLTFGDGFKLLNIMERISDKQILFTPTTNIFGLDLITNNPEAHRSLWKPEMTPDYASIVFPNYHEVWNGGAYVFWKCADIKQDFERVCNELKNKSWAKK